MGGNLGVKEKRVWRGVLANTLSLLGVLKTPEQEGALS
jgi:hypothetical protein